MNRYLTHIYWSDEDDAYVARVPALPGCVSHGDTFAEAAVNIEEATSLWLESSERHGDTVPAPDPILEHLRESKDLLNTSELARRTGLPRPTLVSKIARGTPFSPDERERVKSALAL